MSQYLDWKVGDRVVLVEPIQFPAFPDEQYPEVGRVYTIRSIEPYRDQIAIRLLEIVNPVCLLDIGIGEIAFAASRFRKVQPRKTDISCFTALLNGAKERERV